MRLDQMVSVLRSKNAGPLVLTFDLVFPDEDRFNHVAAAAETLRAEVARALWRSAGAGRRPHLPSGAGHQDIDPPKGDVGGSRRP